MFPSARPSRRTLIALGALVAAALVAAGCARPLHETGADVAWRLAFEPADGPRTPEGARLEAAVTVAARVTDAARLPKDPPALEASVRDAARAWLEEGLRSGALKPPIATSAGSPRPADGASLAPRLAPLGLELTSVAIERLALPGGARREELAPTTDLKLLVIGLDGYDWDIAEPLMRQGRLPVLSRLVEQGTRARLQTIAPVLSPVIWTSMATSRKPQDHGILDFLGTDAQGNAVPVTSNLRKVKAFWNVFGEAGVDTGVVGWWASWPAEPVRGFLVSDRVAYQLFGMDKVDSPPTGKVHPPALWSDIEPLVVRPRDIGAHDLEPFLSPSTRPPDAQDKELLEQFKGVLAQARTYAAIGLELHETRRPRVGAYYFEAPDTACHLFMRYAPPPLPEIDPARQARFAAVVDEVYELHDRILGRFVELADEKTVVLVVSDHGFRSGAARLTRDSRVETPTAADWHEKMGVLVAAGPGIRRGHEVAEASVLDVFPTMLALLGMPVAEDLAGRVLEDALEPSFLSAHPVRRIDTFETGEAPADATFAQASPEDRAMLEQLVAIGYVSPEALRGPSGGSGAPGDASAGAAGGQAAANAHNNLGTVLLQQGDFAPAEAEFRKVVELAPEFVPGHVNLAHVLLRLDRPKDAEASLRKALQLDPSNARALSLLASLQLESGRADEAERIARGAVERDPRSAAAWFSLGQVLEARGRAQDARDAWSRAAELDPDNPEPHNAVGNSLEAEGRWADAATWYARALKVDPTYAAAYNNLALQQQRLGRLDEALATYEEGRRRLPRSSVLLNNLATWHHLQAQQMLQASRGGGDAALVARYREGGLAAAEKAKTLYAEAIAADPLDASPVNNLGALHGELGQSDEQMRLYRRAVEIHPTYADAWHNIGLLCTDQGRWEEAHAALQRALAVRPDAEASLQLDSLALVRLGRGAEAVAQLERTIRRKRSGALLATLGSVLEQQGDRAGACRRFKEALAAEPNLPDLRARVQAACGG